ncbi:MAG TPA: hypothetical protein VHC69_01505 [Polyangiaceae bacterium]|nr:hypothetical protein [Polyangiaceae bacterium]
MEELPDLHIQRPYATLEEYLEGDFWTVDRKEMFLIGAPSFDVGVAVKFTIELDDGTAVVTGEGRVVEYTAPSDEYPGGLKVRFRQLDAEAKAVLKRALELRRKAYQAAMEAAAAEGGNPPNGEAAAPNAGESARSQADASNAAAPATALPPTAAVLPNPPAIFATAAPTASIGPDLLASVAPGRPPSTLAAPPKPRAGERHRANVVSPPPNRDALLGRLRERARSLPVGMLRGTHAK